MLGAFTRSSAEWKASGDPVLFIWSHDWANPFAHLGFVEDMVETRKGLRSSPSSTPKSLSSLRQVLTLLKSRQQPGEVPPTAPPPDRSRAQALTRL
jgi:hypothetical protein